MDQTLEFEQTGPHENPDLILIRNSLGCYFSEEDSETGSGVLYEGFIQHDLDSSEIIIASAKVY